MVFKCNCAVSRNHRHSSLIVPPLLAQVLKLSRDGTPVIDAFKPPRYKVLTRLRASKERQALLRDWLLTAERGLLYTLGFKFNVVHPNYTIVNAAKTWRLEDFVLSQPGMVRSWRHPIRNPFFKSPPHSVFYSRRYRSSDTYMQDLRHRNRIFRVLPMYLHRVIFRAISSECVHSCCPHKAVGIK